MLNHVSTLIFDFRLVKFIIILSLYAHKIHKNHNFHTFNYFKNFRVLHHSSRVFTFVSVA
jgi:hypothetical protein